jgi:hypothetical protein
MARNVKVKPAAKTKPKAPNASQIEYRFGMGNNRMIDKGVPLGARVAGGKSRRDAIAASKLKDKLAAMAKRPFSVPSNAHPKLHDKVSSNVKTVPSVAMKKSNALFSSTPGAKQVKAENARLKSKPSKAETKANARGLKAANKPTKPRGGLRGGGLGGLNKANR